MLESGFNYQNTSLKVFLVLGVSDQLPICNTCLSPQILSISVPPSRQVQVRSNTQDFRTPSGLYVTSEKI